MDLHFKKSIKFPKRYKQSMRNVTWPDLVFHLENYRLYSGTQKAGENSVNHAILCINLSWNIGQN